MKRQFCFIFILSLILTSCNGNRNKNRESFHEEEEYMSAENCQREFNNLINSSENLSTAISETEYFINKWTSVGFYQVDDAKQIRRDLQIIDNLIDNAYDLKSFRSEIQCYPQYENSEYTIIRYAWNKAIKEKEEYLVSSMLSSISSSDFLSVMEDRIGNIIEQDSRAPLGWKVDHIEVIENPEPQNKDGYLAKVATAVFRVYLVGAVFGIDRTSTKIKMTAEIGITESGEQNSGIVDYTYLEGMNF